MSQNVGSETLVAAIECVNDYVDEGYEYPEAVFRAYSEFCGEGVTVEMLNEALGVGA